MKALYAHNFRPPLISTHSPVTHSQFQQARVTYQLTHKDIITCFIYLPNTKKCLANKPNTRGA